MLVEESSIILSLEHSLTNCRLDILWYPRDCCLKMYLLDLICIMASQKLCSVCSRPSTAGGADLHGDLLLVSEGFWKTLGAGTCWLASCCVLLITLLGWIRYANTKGTVRNRKQQTPSVHRKAMPWTMVHICAVKETPVLLSYWLKIMFSVLTVHLEELIFFFLSN